MDESKSKVKAWIPTPLQLYDISARFFPSVVNFREQKFPTKSNQNHSILPDSLPLVSSSVQSRSSLPLGAVHQWDPSFLPTNGKSLAKKAMNHELNKRLVINFPNLLNYLCRRTRMGRPGRRWCGVLQYGRRMV